MAPITLEHAALAIAGIGVALNAYVVFRINQLRTRIRVIPLRPGEALQSSSLLPFDLGVDAGLAGRSGAAPSEASSVNAGKDFRACSNADSRPGLQSVGKRGSLQEICNHCGARLGSSAKVEGNFGDSHRQIAGVDHLDSSRPDIGARQVDSREANLQPHRVLADQPHGVEHAERSAQHRNP